MLSTRSQSSSFIRRMSPSRVMPALFTRMSILPNFSTTWSIMAVTSADAATLALRASDFLPLASMSAAVFCAASRFTSQMATSAPSVASASAISLPMPCAAPVTSAILPLDSFDRSLDNSNRVMDRRGQRLQTSNSDPCCSFEPLRALCFLYSQRISVSFMLFWSSTFRIFASLAIRLTRPESTLPGPISMKVSISVGGHAFDRVFPVERSADLFDERRPQLRRCSARTSHRRCSRSGMREIADRHFLQFFRQPVAGLSSSWHSATERLPRGE